MSVRHTTHYIVASDTTTKRGWTGVQTRLRPPRRKYPAGGIYQTVHLRSSTGTDRTYTEGWQVFEDGRVELDGKDLIGVRAATPTWSGWMHVDTCAWYESGPFRLANRRGSPCSGGLRSIKGKLTPPPKSRPMCRTIVLRMRQGKVTQATATSK